MFTLDTLINFYNTLLLFDPFLCAMCGVISCACVTCSRYPCACIVYTYTSSQLNAHMLHAGDTQQSCFTKNQVPELKISNIVPEVIITSVCIYQ